MNDIMLISGVDAKRQLLRRQLYLVAVFAALFLLAMFLPLTDIHIPHQYYLPLHTLLEFAAILFAFLIFAAVWHTPEKEVSTSLLLIAVTLLAAGWLDFAHVMSYKGMPDLITPSSPQKSIAFWLFARILFAGIILFISFFPICIRPDGASDIPCWSHSASLTWEFCGWSFFRKAAWSLHTMKTLD
jgi:hypothetical protein